jgi:hypothetical protein
VHRVWRTQALDGCDGLSGDISQGVLAGPDRLTIEKDSARPTGGVPAAIFRAGHIEHIAEHPQKRYVR